MSHNSKQYRFIISGGGTGGHIYPALAVADELKKQCENAEFLFIGATGKMEMEKVPKAGYEIKGLPIRGFQRKLSLENLKFPFRLLKSIQMSNAILKDFQPDLVIGTGGYASGPMLMAAQRKGFKTAILEQNAFPGMANKRLGNKANRIFVAYENMDKYFPKDAIVNAGNPIRMKLFETLPSKEEAKQFFGLDVAKPVVLSVGGSLGARTLNNVWKVNSNAILENDCQLLWQTGKLEYKTISSQVEEKDGLVVREFIHRMDMAYACADVIVSRAGAIAISELSVIGKPMILVPFPYAAEDHQTKNAKALSNENAAILVADADASAGLATEVVQLLKNREKQNELMQNVKQFAQPKATENIVKELLKIIE